MNIFKKISVLLLFVLNTNMSVLAQGADVEEASVVGTLFNIDYQKTNDSDAGISEVKFANEIIAINSTGNSGKYWMDGFFRGMRPGTEYLLEITNPISKPYCLSVIPPKGYIAEINGSLYNAMPEINRSSETSFYKIILRSTDAMGPNNVKAVGQCTGLDIGDIAWEAGLGRTSTGNGAGVIFIKSKELNSSIYRREGIGVCVPPLNSDEIKLFYEDLDLDGIKESIRQIKAAQCLVDFVDLPPDLNGYTGYEVRFYETGEFNTSQNLYNPVGNALVVYKFLKIAETSLVISQTDAWGTISHKITSVEDEHTVDNRILKDWTLKTEGGGYVKIKSIDSELKNSYDRLDKQTIFYAGSPLDLPQIAKSSFRINRYYSCLARGIDFNYKLKNEVFNPETPQSYVIEYDYYSTVTNPNFGLLNAIKGPFGNWLVYEYETHNGEINGSSLMSNEFIDWCDNNQVGLMYPALISRTKKVTAQYAPETDAFNFEIDKSHKAKEQVANGSVRQTKVELGYGWNELHPSPIRTQDFIASGSVAASMGAALAFPIVRDPISGSESNYIELLASYEISKRGIWPNSNSEATKWMARYVPSTRSKDMDGSMLMKPYMEIEPGSRKTVYAYARKNSYRGKADAWLEIKVSGVKPSQIDDSPVNRRVSIVAPMTGSVYNESKSLDLYYDMIGRLADLPIGSIAPDGLRKEIYEEARNRYIQRGNFEHEGIQFSNVDSVTLVPGKSLKEVCAFNKKGVIESKENWVYVGNSWKMIDITFFESDRFGRILTVTRQDGLSSVKQVIYKAYYIGLKLAWEIDSSGAITTFSYDGLGRLASKEISSSHNIQTLPIAFVTSYKYDAMDRIVETKIGSIKNSQRYDAGDFIIEETDANGLTKNYTYSEEPGAGMRVDIAFAGGGTETRIHHRNGRLKSITGNSTVPRYLTYGYENDGTQWVRTDVGVDSSSTIRHPRGIEWNDWSGRVIKKEKNSVATSHNLVCSYNYSPSNGRLVSTLETEVSQDGATVSQSLSKLYEYDNWDNISAFGIDVDGGGLSNASSDLLARNQANIIEINGVLYKSDSSVTYPKEGDAQGVTVSELTKLNGLPQGVISEIRSIDAKGNTTTNLLKAGELPGIVKHTKTFADGTSEKSISVLGLPVSSTDRQGGVLSKSYDSSKRLILQTSKAGKRVNSSRYVYIGNTGLLWKTVSNLEFDGSGSGQVTEYSYDSAGRLASIKDANGGMTFNGYNSRNQLIKRWGNATSPTWFEYDSLFGYLLKQYSWPLMQSALPDFATATSPPAGSTVVSFVRDSVSGLITSRTDGFGSGSARVTDYTYDALGQLRTVQTPSCTASTNAVATPRLTVSFNYYSKTGQKASIYYSDGITPSIDFVWHRSADMKSVTEAGGLIRNFNYDFTGNGSTSMELVSEDLPSYYTVLPEYGGFAGGDGKVNRIVYAYTSDGIIGQRRGIYFGNRDESIDSKHIITRGSSLFSFDQGLISDGVIADDLRGLSSTLNFSYAYEEGSALLNHRIIGSLEEKRDYSMKRNLLVSLETKGGGILHSRGEFSYDNLDKKIGIKQTGSLYSIYGGSLNTGYSYDAKGQLTSSAVSAASNQSVQGRSFGYTYDLANNRRSLLRNDAPIGQTSFSSSVTPLNEIASSVNPQWVEISGQVPKGKGIAMHATGESNDSLLLRSENYFHAYHALPSGTGIRKAITELIYSEPGAGEMDAAHPGMRKDLVDRRGIEVQLRPSNEVMKYDARGNLAIDALWIYSWDGADRLRGVESTPEAMNAGLPKIKLIFKYDWMGRRYCKESYSWNNGIFADKPEKVTLFWWNGWDLIREVSYSLTWNGSIIGTKNFISEKIYSWGSDISGSPGGAGGVGGLLSVTSRNAGETAKYYLPVYDEIGNVIGLLNEAGALDAAYEYDPFGNLLRASGPAAAINPFRFATKYEDRETKLVYYNARYFSPASGRFISRDPIGEFGGSNLYAYANNSPTNMADFLGYAPTIAYGPWQEREGVWQRGFEIRGLPNNDANMLPPMGVQAMRYGSPWDILLERWMQTGTGISWSMDWEFYADSTAPAQTDFSYSAVPGENPSNENYGAPLWLSKYKNYGSFPGQENFQKYFWKTATIVTGKFIYDAMAAQFAENYEMTEDYYDSAMMTLNPMYEIMTNGVEAANGQGLHYDNLSKQLSGGQRAWSGVKSVGELALTVAGVKGSAIGRGLKSGSVLTKVETGFFDDIARQATRNASSDKLVLGKYLENGKSYTKVAAHYKATYFKLENWNEVTKGLSNNEIWKINKTFLEQQIQQGKQIILSHNPATATGFYAQEVSFLEALGYDFVQDNWIWKAVR